jgi:hypothetical protein
VRRKGMDEATTQIRGRWDGKRTGKETKLKQGERMRVGEERREQGTNKGMTERQN